MARKNILSQMFDVRPRTKRGDLDMERMAKIRQILNLAVRQSKDKSSRIINLRPRISSVVLRELNKKEKSERDYYSFSRKKQIYEQPSYLFKKFSRAKPAITEALTISHPSREEILVWLEEIEVLNNYLAEHGLEQEEIREIAEELSEPVLEKSIGSLAFDAAGAEEIQESEIEELLVAKPSPAANFDLTEDLLAPTPDDVIVLPVEPSFQIETPAPVEPLSQGWQTIEVKLEPAKPQKNFKKTAIGFAGAGFLIFLVIFGLSLAGRGLLAKSNILSSAMEAYQAMLAAQDSASRLDFGAAQVNFAQAYQNFLRAEEELNSMGRSLLYVLEKLPGGSIIASGSALVEAGQNLAKAGQSFAKIANLLVWEKISDYFVIGQPSLTQKIMEAQQEIKTAQSALALAEESLQKVNTSDLPTELAPAVSSLKEKLPVISEAMIQLNNWSEVFLAVLGHEKPKKYLLIFQNNSEARPTGGFIGTYGVLNLNEGRLENLFIDGIFNLDGQLYEKIIPPKPIQKISTAWSTHDANWFADWPTSAKKIMWFYEKAGGETVDGIISLTPTVIERLLALTGPIDLPQYGVSLNQENFLDAVQYKVEVDYDEELNQPKKILADFAPLFLDRLWQIWPQNYQPILEILTQALAEKHILFYFSDEGLQKVFQEQGWTGEILPTDKDYLSVVNTNINGYKTDRVVEQKIYHQAEVQNDGSIIDTVKIVRTHSGGQSQYDWYNRVNADYLRVYVPLSSRLLSAQGHTLEAYSAPVDYQRLDFSSDLEVQAQEQGLRIDENSGTQVFSESGKTVFGNWVYVSPGETVEIEYQYLLPFKLDLKAENFSYSLLAQKQLGSLDSGFESILRLPQDFKINWQYPENLQINGLQIKFVGDLRVDKFYGMVFER